MTGHRDRLALPGWPNLVDSVVWRGLRTLGLLPVVLFLSAPGWAQDPTPLPEETVEPEPAVAAEAGEAANESADAAADESADEATGDSAGEAEPEDDDRFMFEQQLSAEDGGGKVVVRFDDLESAENGNDVFLGNVEFLYQDVKVTADLYRFGSRHGYLLYPDKEERYLRVPVSW